MASSTSKAATGNVNEVKINHNMEAGLSNLAADNSRRGFVRRRLKFLNNVPWVGFGSLLVSLCCGISVGLVLFFCNERTQGQWVSEVTPNVFVTILNGISTIMLGVAIAQGVAINWWRRVLRGSKIIDLHRSWSYLSSNRHLFLSFRYFNIIALASLVAKFAIVDGVLFQRSISTEAAWEPTWVDQTLTGARRLTFPQTGYLDGKGEETVSETMEWNLIPYGWAQNPTELDASSLDIVGCPDYCEGYLNGIGFARTCESVEERIDYGAQAAASFDDGDTAGYTNLDLFSVSFSENLSKTNSTITAKFVQTQPTGDAVTNFGSCPAFRTTTTCTLIPAIIAYHFASSNSTTTGISAPYLQLLNSEEQTVGNVTFASTYTVVDAVQVQESLEPFGTTTLGGIFVGLDTSFRSAVNMTYKGNSSEGGFSYSTSGSTSEAMLVAIPDAKTCDLSFSDPMSYVLSQLDSWMFMASFDSGNWDTSDMELFEVLASRDPLSTMYIVTWWYYLAGMVSLVLCILCVLPSYWGYWQLSRKVSLGPFEIAHAFGAPILVERDNPEYNGEIKVMMKDIGETQVKLTGGDGAARVIVIQDASGQQREVQIEHGEHISGVVVADENGGVRERHIQG